MKSIIYIILILLPVMCFGAGQHSSKHMSKHHGKNHLAIFGGETFIEGHAYHSLGLDYERAITYRLGIITVGEEVFGEHASSLGGVGLSYHPIEHLKVCIIEGYEYVYSNQARQARGDLLTRLNLEYAFNYHNISVGTALDFDYIARNVIMASGLAIGAHF